MFVLWVKSNKLESQKLHICPNVTKMESIIIIRHTIAMFPVTSRPGHVGLFISVVGKNKTWLDVSYTKFTAKETGSWREFR